ncbi:MAG: hypothetical protein A2277_20700 [Desulfobacterales bacterium RIFOXYA12_FULL_46_15]|nr:MAG: hypothetical protein A2097_03175 [Desulfobacula sp. GWF2_41_7]OGR23155.1 MAG: hypothetical protein A2277_20700 [Desulfobacterales bacterium RIFOXYA12_FULL_46_15]
MPVINVAMGPVSEDQKKALIERLTSEAAIITKMGAENFIVLINEIPFENIGVGGKTIKDIKSGK